MDTHPSKTFVADTVTESWQGFGRVCRRGLTATSNVLTATCADVTALLVQDTNPIFPGRRVSCTALLVVQGVQSPFLRGASHVMHDPKGRLLRGHDAAALHTTKVHFPCTPRYIKAATESGALPHYMIAGRRHYDPADIELWVASLRRVGTSSAAS